MSAVGNRLVRAAVRHRILAIALVGAAALAGMVAEVDAAQAGASVTVQVRLPGIVLLRYPTSFDAGAAAHRAATVGVYSADRGERLQVSLRPDGPADPRSAPGASLTLDGLSPASLGAGQELRAALAGLADDAPRSWVLVVESL